MVTRPSLPVSSLLKGIFFVGSFPKPNNYALNVHVLPSARSLVWGAVLVYTGIGLDLKFTAILFALNVPRSSILYLYNVSSKGYFAIEVFSVSLTPLDHSKAFPKR